MCKVSILIPTHEGRDKFVIKILQKLSLQTYSNFKVIIADNDYLKKEVPSYIKDFNFEIEYIINKKNLGPQKNVMNLISLVKTDFFKFIFSDDLISEDFLEKCVSILDENTDYSAVFTKRIFIDENGKYTGDANFYDFDESKKLLVQNLFEETCEKLDWFPGEMTNFIFRKKEYVFSELFTPKFGTQKSFICSYDLVLFLNLLKKDDNVYFINEPLCMIRNHDDR